MPAKLRSIGWPCRPTYRDTASRIALPAPVSGRSMTRPTSTPTQRGSGLYDIPRPDDADADRRSWRRDPYPPWWATHRVPSKRPKPRRNGLSIVAESDRSRRQRIRRRVHDADQGGIFNPPRRYCGSVPNGALGSRPKKITARTGGKDIHNGRNGIDQPGEA